MISPQVDFFKEHECYQLCWFNTNININVYFIKVKYEHEQIKFYIKNPNFGNNN